MSESSIQDARNPQPEALSGSEANSQDFGKENSLQIHGLGFVGPVGARTANQPASYHGNRKTFKSSRPCNALRIPAKPRMPKSRAL